jgi:hypothetical protein
LKRKETNMTSTILIALRDLRYLEVACPHCHRAIVFDLDRAKAQLPEACADCELKFDPEAVEAVGLLARVYQTRNQTARVRIRIEALER